IRLADAEIFGGGVRLFRDRPGAGEEGGPTGPRSDDSWCSTLPHPGVRFFLLNPTAMMRVAAFEAMRGCGDYGDLECNKCGLDTEFYVGAYYAGVRFAISREVVVNYRVHADSAVNNERTGWGSRPRLWSQTENARRFADFQRGPFDPRVFGALRSADGLTRRVEFR